MGALLVVGGDDASRYSAARQPQNLVLLSTRTLPALRVIKLERIRSSGRILSRQHFDHN